MYGQILPALNPALRDKRARVSILNVFSSSKTEINPQKWDHSNRWGFGSDGYLYDFVKRWVSSSSKLTILSWKGSTPPGGVEGPTGISTTLQSAPKTLTPPDGVPAPTDTSGTLSLPRDSTCHDGVVDRMAISTTLLRSRCGAANFPTTQKFKSCWSPNFTFISVWWCDIEMNIVLEICRVNVLVNWVQEVSLVKGREFTLGENIWHFPQKYMKVEN